MNFLKASALDFDPRPQLGAIFADGFYNAGLSLLHKDKAVLGRALAHMFILDYFYTAVEGNEIISIVAVVEKKPPPVKLNKKILRQELGFFRGSLAYWGLNKFLVNAPYPFPMAMGMASIEFVATAPNHRGKGAAKKLLEHVFNEFGLTYAQYVLEVVDNNASAIKLYEKLGFKEFTRKPAPSKRAGFDFHVYMKRG